MKRLPDLDPAELAVDRLLSAVTPKHRRWASATR